MTEEDLRIISEALDIWEEEGPFESALSVAVKKRGGGFERYIFLIGELRERAIEKGIEVHEMAMEIAESEEQENGQGD